MKKLTKEQVSTVLMLPTSAVVENLGEGTRVVYYLHVKEDGTVVDCAQKSDMDFTSGIAYWDYADTLEEFEDMDMEDLFDSAHENMSWEPFADVVEDLTDQANEWLAKIEQEKEQEDM